MFNVYMSCVPSNKIKQFANKQKNILKKFRSTKMRFEESSSKYLVMKLINHSIKTLGLKDAALFVYHFFPNVIVEKLISYLKGFEPNCDSSVCEPIRILGDNNFDDQTGSSDKPWLIKFYSLTCSHCVDFQPIWKKVPANLDGFHFGEIPLDHGRDLVKRFQVKSLPHIMLLKNGQSYPLLNGSYTIENIIDFVQHPETYNDRSDDEIDCSNTIKSLIRLFSEEQSTSKPYSMTSQIKNLSS